MQKMLKGVLYIISFLFVFVISLFIFIPLINNYRLSTFAHQLDTFALPQSTMQIEQKTICGKLNGNGNGMDFLVCTLVKSDLALDALKQYYTSITFKAVRDDEGHKVNVEVLHVNGSEVKTTYLQHGSINFDTLKNNLDYSNYYIVLLYDGGYSADFDIRGH